ncbi:MAG TPA: hypothetical protein VGO62_04150, partial [Myxococcota bacterium]
ADDQATPAVDDVAAPEPLAVSCTPDRAACAWVDNAGALRFRDQRGVRALASHVCHDALHSDSFHCTALVSARGRYVATVDTIFDTKTGAVVEIHGAHQVRYRSVAARDKANAPKHADDADGDGDGDGAGPYRALEDMRTPAERDALCRADPLRFLSETRLEISLAPVDNEIGALPCPVTPDHVAFDVVTSARASLVPPSDGWSALPCGWQAPRRGGVLQTECYPAGTATDVDLDANDGPRRKHKKGESPPVVPEPKVPRSHSRHRVPIAIALSDDALLLFENASPRTFSWFPTVASSERGVASDKQTAIAGATIAVFSAHGIATQPVPALDGTQQVVGTFDDNWHLLSSEGHCAFVRIVSAEP